jgi:Flp pilus assembly protein protease CpaA
VEVRLLIAYFLIAVLVVGAFLFVRHVVIERREHRRIMRGHSRYRRASRRSRKSLTQP